MEKKTIALVLAVSMAMGMLAGCGGKKASEEAQGNIEESAGGVTEVVFWHCMTDAYLENLESVVEGFNSGIGAEENIHVKMVFQDWPGTSALMIALQAKDYDNLPDLFQTYAVSVNQIRDEERMLWIEDLINAEGSAVKKEDLVEQAANAYSIGGKMLGAPMNMNGILLYYNKDLFAKAGLDPEAPPATIEEMAAAASALGSVCDYGLTLCPDIYEVESWIECQGEGTFFGNNESGHSGYMTDIQYDQDGSLHAFLTEWEKVVNCGSYKYVKDDYNSEFVGGQTAMLIVSSSKLSTFYNLTQDKFELGVAPLPTVSKADKRSIALGGGGLFALNNGDEKVAAASSRFVQYILSEEVQSKIFVNMGYFPSNKACLENKEVLDHQEKYPGYKTFIDEILNSNPKIQSAFVLNYNDINSIIKDTMLQYNQGIIGLEEAESMLTDDVRASINNYLRANPLGE